MTQPKYQRPRGNPSHRYLKNPKKATGGRIWILVTLIAVCLSVFLSWQMLLPLIHNDALSANTASGGSGTAILDFFDSHIHNTRVDALSGLEGFENEESTPLKKTYFLSDSDLIAPEPNPDCWGTTDDPSTLQWLLDGAAEKLGVTETLFRTDVELYADSVVTYYLDDTILCITWKQDINDCVYTISEVKIAHASQFRRFLADGTYGSEKQYYPSEMAIAVNAVTASSGDFYKFRSWGVNVYQGKVMNVKTSADTCFIDGNGDLRFCWAGDYKDAATAQAFVDENDVRFSLTFGPVLIADGVNVVPSGEYSLGQINEKYARMAICQTGELHYLMVAANQEANSHYNVPTANSFAEQLLEFGCKQAYALDGGQTAAIITNDTLINRPTYGVQRQISDIIYFATAIPEGE